MPVPWIVWVYMVDLAGSYQVLASGLGFQSPDPIQSLGSYMSPHRMSTPFLTEVTASKVLGVTSEDFLPGRNFANQSIPAAPWLADGIADRGSPVRTHLSNFINFYSMTSVSGSQTHEKDVFFAQKHMSFFWGKPGLGWFVGPLVCGGP